MGAFFTISHWVSLFVKPKQWLDVSTGEEGRHRKALVVAFLFIQFLFVIFFAL